MSSDDFEYNIKAFLSEGEEFNFDEWDLIDDRRCDEMTLSERKLNTVIQFARIPDDDKNIEKSISKQDTSIFKIRYKYAGLPAIGDNSRDFCKAVWNSGKVFKEETLNKEQFHNTENG